MTSKTKTFPLRPGTPEERTSWEAAAAKAGLSLNAWIRRACNRAAEDLSDVTPKTVRLPELELARGVRPVAFGGKRFTGPDPKEGRKH